MFFICYLDFYIFDFVLVDFFDFFLFVCFCGFVSLFVVVCVFLCVFCVCGCARAVYLATDFFMSLFVGVCVFFLDCVF